MNISRLSTLLQNQAVAVALILLFAVPVLFAQPDARRIDQLTAYGFLGLLLFGVWAFRAGDRLTIRKVQDYVTSGPNLPILLYVGWNIGLTLFSPEPFYSQLALLQLVVGVLIYGVVVYQFRHKEQVQALLGSLVCIGVVLVLMALATDGPRRRIYELSGWFQDRQLFGAFLMMIFPVILGVAAGSKNRLWKICAQSAAILVFGALLLTNCRSAWLGVVVGTATFGLLGSIFIWKLKLLEQKKHEVLLTPVLCLVVVGIFVTFVQGGGALRDRAGTFERVMEDPSVKDRLNQWNVGLNMVKESPFFGHGLGAYAVAQSRYNPETRSEAMIRQLGPTLDESPHNFYIQTAAEQGVIGLLLFLGAVGAFFVYGIRAIPRMDKGLRLYTLVGSLSAVAGVMVDAIANPAWTFPEVTTFFWMVVGVGMCAAGLGVVAEEEPATGRSRRNQAATVFGLPTVVFKAVRMSASVLAILVMGAHILSLNLTAAAAGPPPPGDPGGGGGGGGGGGPRPVYSDFITKLDVDWLNDAVNPTDAFNVNNGQINHDRLASFHVYALTDDPRFYANVTAERRNLKFKALGIKGKFYYSESSGNPRFFFNPAKGSEGKTGTILIAYKTTKPKEIFKTAFTLTVLGPAPINTFGGPSLGVSPMESEEVLQDSWIDVNNDPDL